VERSIGSPSPWRPPTRSKPEERPQVTGEDIEFALNAAEGLAAEADRAEHQANTTRFWASVATALLLALSALTAGTLTGHVGTAGFRVLAAVATVILLTAAASSWWWILRADYRRKSSNLRLSLAQDIVGIVREVMLDVAEREQWSYMRLEATRLRVSAFPPSAVPISKARRSGIH
jgi:hypothetical protein